MPLILFSSVASTNRVIHIHHHAHQYIRTSTISAQYKTQLTIVCADNLRFDQFCERVRSIFGNDVKAQNLKSLYRKITMDPDALVDWSEVRLSFKRFVQCRIIYIIEVHCW